MGSNLTRNHSGLDLEAKRIWVRYSLFAGVIDVQHRLPELVGKSQAWTLWPRASLRADALWVAGDVRRSCRGNLRGFHRDQRADGD
jgi:hypothetical protein